MTYLKNYENILENLEKHFNIIQQKMDLIEKFQ